jgi:hypothetical protein
MIVLVLLVGCSEPTAPADLIPSTRYELLLKEPDLPGVDWDGAEACGMDVDRVQPMGSLELDGDRFRLELTGVPELPVDVGAACPVIVTTDRLENVIDGTVEIRGDRVQLINGPAGVVGSIGIEVLERPERIELEAAGWELVGVRKQESREAAPLPRVLPGRGLIAGPGLRNFASRRRTENPFPFHRASR